MVLFTNEENGLRGAMAYRDAYVAEASKHVMALESDIGVFEPMRLGFSGNDRARQMMADVVELLRADRLPAAGAGRRRCRHRPHRPGRPGPDHGTGGRPDEVLPDPPHARPTRSSASTRRRWPRPPPASPSSRGWPPRWRRRCRGDATRLWRRRPLAERSAAATMVWWQSRRDPVTKTFVARFSGALVTDPDAGRRRRGRAGQAADRARLQDADVRLLHQVGGAPAGRRLQGRDAAPRRPDADPAGQQGAADRHLVPHGPGRAPTSSKVTCPRPT